MSQSSNAAVRFTAWTAIVGGLFAYANVGLVLAVTRGDTAMILDGASMLALPADQRDLFRWGMFADILGFYLPVLAIGAYLWHRFRDRTGAMGDMALLAIALYAIVGVAGAALQLAALNPLAQLHAGGDASVRAAAETAWTAIANASQKGLWWSEGPVVLFWGLVVGPQLGKEAWGQPRLVLLKITGWCFGLFFLSGMFAALEPLMKAMLVIVVLIFPLWMLSFGTQLLRCWSGRAVIT
ncbi:hypothetical protein NX784_13840 [Massilia pinisoli]|uniref:DUF4386 family protein n=1 Tax=Massilia pinisoli TaxID=1772194 RepID=A0ABT1ZRY3_9BURK|nr:hypothetical protein [Massilia pinisoli]MCS0582678.1 hypothetical protein [Massilia pinisoli]